MNSQFAFPRTGLIGQVIAYENFDGTVTITTIVDAGQMTGYDADHIICENGTHWSTDQFSEWRVVRSDYIPFDHTVGPNA